MLYKISFFFRTYCGRRNFPKILFGEIRDSVKEYFLSHYLPIFLDSKHFCISSTILSIIASAMWLFSKIQASHWPDKNQHSLSEIKSVEQYLFEFCNHNKHQFIKFSDTTHHQIETMFFCHRINKSSQPYWFQNLLPELSSDHTSVNKITVAYMLHQI